MNHRDTIDNTPRSQRPRAIYTSRQLSRTYDEKKKKNALENYVSRRVRGAHAWRVHWCLSGGQQRKWSGVFAWRHCRLLLLVVSRRREHRKKEIKLKSLVLGLNATVAHGR